MCLRNTTQRFGIATKLFHWCSVVLVISLLAVGLLMTGLENTPDKFKLYGLHKSGGITLLAIACAWIFWRAINPKPALPDTISKAQVRAATAAKYALLTMLLVMPLTGWGMSSAAGFPVSVFGQFTLPDLVAPDKELSHFLKEVHELVANFLMLVIALHASAALLHHFYYKDGVLKRMLPSFGKHGDD
jgi:cytochrome b561